MDDTLSQNQIAEKDEGVTKIKKVRYEKDMKSKATMRNVFTSMLYQVVAMIYGLVVPRIILETFGSEVNGLVSSLNQFLGYITLLEGGLTSVVMAALYKPLSEHNISKVSAIIKSTDSFFKKIAVIFIGYSLVVAVVYPMAVKTSFGWSYVFSLTLIIAISLFIQYFFSLTYRILIIADQNGYIVFLAQIGFTVVNLILTVGIVKIYPEIHILKLFNAIAYIVQPVVFRLYIKKRYPLEKDAEPDKDALAQRWDGFGQNLAYFIHTNTDVAVLTIFSTLLNVSVYAVYYMITNSLKTLVMSISTALVPSLGSILVGDDDKKKNEMFDLYEFVISFVAAFAFVCGSLLITPFVNVYTKGITDADYYQPIFGYLLMIAEGIYCFRDPYVNVAYASGHFKQTAKYAYVEAFTNIIISIVLVSKYGLIGVATGTMISMVYRMIAHVWYLKNNILFRSFKKWVKSICVFSAAFILSFIIGKAFLIHEVENYFQWFEMAICVAIASMIIFSVFSMLFYKEYFIKLIGKMTKKV